MTTKTDITLLPCPFCGGPAHFSRSDELVNVRCEGWNPGECLGAGPNCYTEVEAAAGWNRRAAVEAGRQHREEPFDTPATVPENSQNWAELNGVTAWQLIERHADNWADIERMMEEFVAAKIEAARQNHIADVRKMVPSDEDIEALEKKHIAPYADRLGEIALSRPPYQNTEQFRRVKAYTLDLLSRYGSSQPAASAAAPSDDDLLGCAGVTRHHDGGMPMIIGTADIRRFADCVRKHWGSSQPASSGQDETRMDAGSSARNDGDFGQPAASAEPVDLLNAIDGLMDFAPSYMGGGAGMVRGGEYIKKSEVVRAIKSCAAPVAQEPADPTMPYEQALSELIDKIVPDLDTGDILADARQASDALDGRPSVAQEPVGVRDLLHRAKWVLELVDKDQCTTICTGGLVSDISAYLAAPVAAQAQPVPDVLFDGYAVLSALDDKARSRTSPENVSDVLDAVVRLMRAIPQTVAQAQLSGNSGELASAQDREDAEHILALKEAGCNAASDSYLSARPSLPETIETRILFEDGFDRGYDAARAAKGE